MATFDIILQTGGSLHAGGEPSDYVSAYSGRILCTRDRDGKVFKVGKVKAYLIHAELAGRHGESVFDVCDAHSQEMHELYAALFDPGEDELKESVRSQFDALAPDVLVLDYVLLHPRWRGLRIGLLAARKMVDLLGGGCGLAVSWVYPLNPDAEEFKKVPPGWIPRHNGREEERAARGRLRWHFKRMGFERIAGTRFHGLSTFKPVSTLADLIRRPRN